MTNHHMTNRHIFSYLFFIPGNGKQSCTAELKIFIHSIMRNLALLFLFQLIEAGTVLGRFTDSNPERYPNCDIRLVYDESIDPSPVIPGNSWT